MTQVKHKVIKKGGKATTGSLKKNLTEKPPNLIANHDKKSLF